MDSEIFRLSNSKNTWLYIFTICNSFFIFSVLRLGESIPFLDRGKTGGKIIMKQSTTKSMPPKHSRCMSSKSLLYRIFHSVYQLGTGFSLWPKFFSVFGPSDAAKKGCSAGPKSVRPSAPICSLSRIWNLLAWTEKRSFAIRSDKLGEEISLCPFFLPLSSLNFRVSED